MSGSELVRILVPIRVEETLGTTWHSSEEAQTTESMRTRSSITNSLAKLVNVLLEPEQSRIKVPKVAPP